MPRTPTSVPSNLLSQLGAGSPGAGGRSAPRGSDAFHDLLQGPGGASRPGATAAAGASSGAGDDAAAGARAGGAGGLAQRGASAAQLLATKVGIAGGLRSLEAETMQAIRAALNAGDRAKAMTLLKGAAQVVGAMLGGTDAARGTNAIERIAAARAALKDGAAQASGAKGQPVDPLAQAAAMFALVSQALGLVRPATATAAAQGGAAAAQAAAQAAGAAKGAPQPGSLAALLDGLTRAGQVAREAGGAGGAQIAGADQPPGAGPLAGKAGPEKSGAVSGAAAARHAATAKAGDKRAPDPMALLAQGGAAPGGADGRTAAMLAGAAGVVAPADPTGAVGAAMQAGSAAQSGAPQSQAAAFAGMLGTQIRAAEPAEGVTRIALSPRGLGEIQIDMKRDSSGRLNVVLRVENPLVLAALRNDHMRLSQMFASPASGAPPVLDFEAFTGRDGQGGQQQPRQAARTLAAAGGAETGDAETGGGTAAEGAAPARQDRIGRGALDIST